MILVMGLGYPSDMWFRITPVLAEHYRVLLLDNRGAGRTGDVPGAPYTVEMMAGDVAAVLDAAEGVVSSRGRRVDGRSDRAGARDHDA